MSILSESIKICELYISVSYTSWMFDGNDAKTGSSLAACESDLVLICNIFMTHNR